MKHGFIKAAVASPQVRVADTEHNIAAHIRIAKEADALGVRILVFPELGITGCTCGDLFDSDTLLLATRQALLRFLQETADTTLLSVVGLPLNNQNKLYNCAAFCQSGKLLGVVPKTAISNRFGLSDGRWFAPAPNDSIIREISAGGQTAPFGKHLLFVCREIIPNVKLAAELGEDLCLSVSPSCFHTAAGATVICAPSASAEAVGYGKHRKNLASVQSAKTHCAYLYSGAGMGESTTDLVFGGHGMILENGKLLAESPAFSGQELTCCELDISLLETERRRSGMETGLPVPAYREIPFFLPPRDTAFTRSIDAHPFIPDDPAERKQRCEDLLAIQAEGLKQRLQKAYAKKAVIGISGGLDSTLALLVAVRAMDLLGRPHTDILAVTMPCFGTTKRTKNNATVLCEELGVEFRCVKISKAVQQHFADIGHDPDLHDVTYENSQARERTQVLMDIANQCSGMVIGTGDLSELALGWATYNGDHMSMYGVNASIPKTLIRYIVASCADQADTDKKAALASALRDILDTPVSPELLPADEHGDIAQKTEDLVGPYELHDFYLYYMLRYGFGPVKLFFMAKHALGGSYSDAVLLKWLEIFVKRFFAQQFKRSCLPDGPKVGSVTLSPRGDWKMPSDASSAMWLREIEALKKQI